jgi:hypothetical protein
VANPKDLITSGRAVKAMQYYADNTTTNAILQTLVTACSDAIEKYCRRRFVSTARDELYNGNGDRRLMLREYPIQSMDSVRYRPVTVLKVINNSVSQATQQARVQVTATGLQLVEVAAGVKTITTTGLDWITCPTLTALTAAISAVGRGWTAQVVGDASGDYGQWPSADLYVPSSYGDGMQSQGALTAMRQNAELKLHTYELAGYQWDARGWLLRAIPYTDPELLHPEDLIWPVGIDNFRVQYTAGYSTIPEAVQQACALWVAMSCNLTQRDPLLSHQAVSGSATLAWTPDVANHQPPLAIQALLAPYRRYTVATNQG